MKPLESKWKWVISRNGKKRKLIKNNGSNAALSYRQVLN